MEEKVLLIDKGDSAGLMYDELMRTLERSSMEQRIYRLMIEVPMLSRSQILLYFGKEEAMQTVTALNHMLKKEILVHAGFISSDGGEEYYMLRRNDLSNLPPEHTNRYINSARNKREAVNLQKSFWVYLDFKNIGQAGNFAREQSNHDFFTMVFEMNYTTYDILFLEKGRDYVQTFTILKGLEKNYDQWDKDHLHRILLLEDKKQLADAQKYHLVNGLEFYAIRDYSKGKTLYYNGKA